MVKGRTVDIQGVRNNQKLPYPYVEKQREKVMVLELTHSWMSSVSWDQGKSRTSAGDAN